MARPRRTVRPDGTLFCKPGDHWVHISEFGQSSGAYICVRNPETDVDEWFGKPQSWCKACVKEYNRKKHEEALERERKLSGGELLDDEYKNLSTPPTSDDPPVKLGPPEPQEEEDPVAALIERGRILNEHWDQQNTWTKEDWTAFEAFTDEDLRLKGLQYDGN